MLDYTLDLNIISGKLTNATRSLDYYISLAVTLMRDHGMSAQVDATLPQQKQKSKHKSPFHCQWKKLLLCFRKRKDMSTLRVAEVSLTELSTS